MRKKVTRSISETMMGLTAKQLDSLRQLYRSKGDILEAAMVERLVSRGIDEVVARSAAKSCSKTIWRNGLVSGAATTVILGTMFTPVVGGIAGGSMAALSGWFTLLNANACAPIREDALASAARVVANEN